MPSSSNTHHCCKCSLWVKLGLLSVWELILGIGLSLCWAFSVYLELLEKKEGSNGVPPQTNSTSSSSAASSEGKTKGVMLSLGILYFIWIHFYLAYRLCRAAFSRDLLNLRYVRDALTIVWMSCGLLILVYLWCGDNIGGWGPACVGFFPTFIGALFYRALAFIKLSTFLVPFEVEAKWELTRRVLRDIFDDDDEEYRRYRRFRLPARPVDSLVVNGEASPKTEATLSPPPYSVVVKTKEEEEKEEPPT